MSCDAQRPAPPAVIDVVIVALPHMANFDDFDPLRHRVGVRVRFIREPAAFGAPDLVILPGSKTTIADLCWLRRTGFADLVMRHRRAGRPVLGVCGGFQMLGAALDDPEGVESSIAAAEGLGLLGHKTVFRRAKRTRQVAATLSVAHGPFAGLRGLSAKCYEIRAGVSVASDPPLAQITASGDTGPETYTDGGVDPDGLVLGTYLHGLLHEPSVREGILHAVARLAGRELPAPVVEPDLDAELDRVTAHFAAHVDLPRIAGWVGLL